MFDNLLIPVDGSDPAKRAAKYGLELAAVYDASVDVLHVVEDESEDGDRTPLDEVANLDIAGDPAVETHLVEGTPKDTILAHVDDGDTDLVVMGRHSRRGITQHLLGSTTERVLRGTEVPVLTVPGGDIDAETGRNYEDVLVTTDGSEVAERAAPLAADVARRTGAALHLLTVVDVVAEGGVFDAGGVSAEFVDRLRDSGRDALDSLAEGIDTSDLDVRSSVVEDRAVDGIAAYANEADIDLLVLASEGETNLLGQHLGGTTSRVLDTVKRPVLVLPSPD